MAATVAKTGNTIDVVAAATISANTFAFEGDICVWHSDAASSGDLTEPAVEGVTLQVEKTNTTDTYTVGADVQLDASTQKSVTAAGTVGGCAAKASSNTDTYVWVKINRQLA